MAGSGSHITQQEVGHIKVMGMSNRPIGGKLGVVVVEIVFRKFGAVAEGSPPYCFRIEVSGLNRGRGAGVAKVINRSPMDQCGPNAMSNEVNLSVYNMLGRKVATLVNEQKSEGTHQVIWDASEYSSGIYFYKIEAGEFVEYRKCLLVK